LYVTGIFLPPQFQFASGRIVNDSVVFVAFASETRSLTFWSLSFTRNAPRMTGIVWMPAQNWLQHESAVLKPTMSCSWPKTTMSLAWRAAVVRGTVAQDWANGAAAGVASAACAERATLVAAVAVVATIVTASTVPAMSHRRLCMQ
jgi:hypothetical protein